MSKTPRKKKGGGKGNYSSYLAANKWCKNVAFRAFHDVDDNKGSYRFLSTMSMKTIEKRGSATELTRPSRGGHRPPLQQVDFQTVRPSKMFLNQMDEADGAALISSVAPGFSPASAAPKGRRYVQIGQHRAPRPWAQNLLCSLIAAGN